MSQVDEESYDEESENEDEVIDQDEDDAIDNPSLEQKKFQKKRHGGTHSDHEEKITFENQNTDSHTKIKNQDKDTNTIKDVELTPEQLNVYKEEINEISLNVFLNFAKFYYQEKDFLMSFQVLIKLLVDMGIATSRKKHGKFTLQRSEIDTILKQISPKKVSKITSTQFMNFIILLARKYSPNKFSVNPRSTLFEFVNKYFAPISKLINEWDTKSTPVLFPYKQIEVSINEIVKSIDKKTIHLFRSIQKGILMIYKLYFSFEYNKKSNTVERLVRESLTSMAQFSKDFELVPDLLSIEKLGIFFNCLIDEDCEIFEKNYGYVFTLNKFCLFLICLSNYLYTQYSEELWEKVNHLLNRLGNSKGKENAEKKFNVKFTESCQIQIDNELFTKLSSKKSLIRQQTEGSKISYKKVISSVRDSDPILANIFDIYATIGDKFNFNQMTLTSFIKFLRDFEIIDMKKIKFIQSNDNNGLPTEINRHKTTGSLCSINNEIFTEVEANLIFFDICGIKNSVISKSEKSLGSEKMSTCLSKRSLDVSMRLNFGQFIRSLHMIAEKVHSDISKEDAFNYFLDNDLKIKEYQKKADNSYSQVIEIINHIKETELRSILLEFQNILYFIYLTYSDEKSNLTFEKFFQVYKDFEIFPNIMNLIETKKLFFLLAKVYEEKIKSGLDLEGFIEREHKSKNLITPNPGNEEEEIIDFDFFLLSFGVSSSLVKRKEETNDEEKMLIVFMTMVRSKGVSNPRKLIGSGKLQSLSKLFIDCIVRVRNKYSEFFKEKNEIKEMMNCDNMFDYLFNE